MSTLGNKEVMARNIKYYMSLSNVSQTELCTTLNFKMSTFSDWIHAKTYPRIDKIELLANYFGITKADLVEEHNDNEQFSSKDELDIAKRLEATLNDLESNEALMFSGEPLDDATKELLRLSLENSLRIAKVHAKEKYTPKKYKNDK